MSITIPPEALEAAKRAYINCEDDDNCIEAACKTMLSAWPGMEKRHVSDRVTPRIPECFTGTFPALILPISETPNE